MNVILLCTLALAVLNIRPVYILSNPAEKKSMFVFALMLIVERIFAAIQTVEVYFRGIGQTQVRAASLRYLRELAVPLPFYIAALVIAARKYWGDDESSHRLLAEATEDTNVSNDATTNVPIWLTLFGHITSLALLAVNVIFCYPGGGRHKEM